MIQSGGEIKFAWERVADTQTTCSKLVKIGGAEDIHVRNNRLDVRIATCGLPVFESYLDLLLMVNRCEFQVVESLGRGAEAEVNVIELRIGGVGVQFVYRRVFAKDGLSACATHTAMRILKSRGIPTVTPCLAAYDPDRGVNFNLMLFGQPRYIDGSQYLTSLFKIDPSGKLARKKSAELRVEMLRIHRIARRILMTRASRRLITSNCPYEVDLYKGFGDWDDGPVYKYDNFLVVDTDPFRLMVVDPIRIRQGRFGFL